MADVTTGHSDTEAKRMAEPGANLANSNTFPWGLHTDMKYGRNLPESISPENRLGDVKAWDTDE